MKLFDVFEKTVTAHGLAAQNDRILIALSGGSDSVTLLRLFERYSKKYGIELACAHVNHNLRDTADRDMEFCSKLCAELGIPIHILSRNIGEEAKKCGMSEELYARNVRYEFFDSLGYDKIATAHNKNDNAETILFNFMRGASLNGLCGIPYKRGNIIRPLLDIKKSEIIEFCRENGYEYMTDETNFKDIYTRNKIRLNLIPEIEGSFNANFVDTVTANSEIIKKDEEYFSGIVNGLFKGKISHSDAENLPYSVLSRMIQRYFKLKTGSVQNLSCEFIEAITELLKKNRTGAKIDLPDGYEAYMSYGDLVIGKKTETFAFEYEIFPEIPLFIPEIGKTVTLIRDEKGKIFLPDTEKLTVRSKRTGDWFMPVGMQGRKKLSDYFTDRKIPKRMRVQIPLLVKNGEIVSVIGMRDDRRFSDKTNTSYSIILKEAENAE